MSGKMIKRDKSLKMFVYQPLFHSEWNDKTKKTVEQYKRTIISKFPFCRMEVGDVFTTEKRPADYHKLRNQAEAKVEAVRYNLAEDACIVILERKTFKNIKDLDRYVSGKASV